MNDYDGYMSELVDIAILNGIDGINGIAPIRPRASSASGSSERSQRQEGDGKSGVPHMQGEVEGPVLRSMTAPAAPNPSSASMLPPARARSATTSATTTNTTASTGGGGDEDDEEEDGEEEGDGDMDVGWEDVGDSVPGAFAMNSRARWLRHATNNGICDNEDGCDCCAIMPGAS